MNEKPPSQTDNATFGEPRTNRLQLMWRSDDDGRWFADVVAGPDVEWYSGPPVRFRGTTDLFESRQLIVRALRERMDTSAGKVWWRIEAEYVDVTGGARVFHNGIVYGVWPEVTR